MDENEVQMNPEVAAEEPAMGGEEMPAAPAMEEAEAPAEDMGNDEVAA